MRAELTRFLMPQPRTIASTHFQCESLAQIATRVGTSHTRLIASAVSPPTAVFHKGLLSKSLPIDIGHMRIVVPDTIVDSGGSTLYSSSSDDISYMYQLDPGLARSSQAGACARLFGISPDIVDEANKVSGFLARFELEGFLQGEEGNEADSHEYEGSERIAKRLLTWEPEDDAEAVASEKTVDDYIADIRKILGDDLEDWPEV